jgi:uncharacterized cupredoxin-like copper-binding protein
MGPGVRLAAAGVALGVLSSCTPASGAERVVTLTMEHSSFDPARLHFSAGETVRFVVRNTDPIDHELIIGDETVQAVHEKGTERHHGAKAGEVSVPAGESAETTYAFDEPGTLIFGCHLPGHYDFGMRGTISIKGES